MNSSIFDRTRGVIDPDQLTFPVTIIGCGAVGSHVPYLLAKCGCSNMTLFDGDTVALQNIPLQWYMRSQIGLLKTVALHARLHGLFPTLSVTEEGYYTDQGLSGVVVAAVDKLSVRAQIWMHIRYSTDVVLFVDGRTDREEVHTFSIRPSHPEDVAFYDTKVPSPDTVVGEEIGGRCSSPIAGVFAACRLAQNVVNWARGLPNRRLHTDQLATAHGVSLD